MSLAEGVLEEHGGGREGVRIGVFICHCGTNIGGYVDVPAVVEYIKGMPGVVHVEDNLYTCAEDGLASIKAAIKENGLNRVVVASCTPRTHAHLFQTVCESVGLNRYLFTFVNVREHCSWVHMKDRDGATEKAKDLVRMGVARARLLVPLVEERIPVTPVAVVIGGGISGMTAALSIATQGFPIHLIEKEANLGGYVRNLSNLWMKSGDPATSIDPIIKEVMTHPKITVYLGCKVKAVEGFIGNFKVTITGQGENKVNVIDAGAIIVTIGAMEFVPEGMFGYDQYDNVVTLAELEILSKKEAIPHVKDVAFIQCAGSRGMKYSYCSRICCNVSLKNAINLTDKINQGLQKKYPKEEEELMKEGIPHSVRIDATKKDTSDEIMKRRRTRRRRERTGAQGSAMDEMDASQKANITIFNRTINAYGVHHELFYNAARAKRIKFIMYDITHLPEVMRVQGKLVVKYFQHSLGDWRNLKVDMVVLATPLIPTDTAEEVSKLLKVPLGRDGFFLEAHSKLRPVEFATDGIYLAGTCRAPADITESVLQANAAASKAAVPLTKGYVQAEALTSKVNLEKCCGCGTCKTVCPCGAIEVKKKEFGYKAYTNVAACKGCGCCAASCPEKAISMDHYSDTQLTFEALNALREETL